MKRLFHFLLLALAFVAVSCKKDDAVGVITLNANQFNMSANGTVTVTMTISNFLMDTDLEFPISIQGRSAADPDIAVKNQDYTVTDTKFVVKAGTNYGTITFAAANNYGGEQLRIPFTITKIPAGMTAGQFTSAVIYMQPKSPLKISFLQEEMEMLPTAQRQQISVVVKNNDGSDFSSSSNLTIPINIAQDGDGKTYAVEGKGYTIEGRTPATPLTYTFDLTVPAGKTGGTFNVIRETEWSADRSTVAFSIGNVGQGYIIEDPSSVTLTIDQTTLPIAKLVASATKFTAPTLTASISIDKVLTSDLTVKVSVITADASAAAFAIEGEQFSIDGHDPADGSTFDVVIPAGQTEATITMNRLIDQKDDAHNVFRLSINKDTQYVTATQATTFQLF